MTQIAGGYTFQGKEPFVQLQIKFPPGATSGAFYGWLGANGGGGAAIAGTYNAATLELTFNDGSFPGQVLDTTLFRGMAMLPTIAGSKVSLSGTWTEQALTLVAGGGTGKEAALAGKVGFQVAYKTGVWIATDYVFTG